MVFSDLLFIGKRWFYRIKYKEIIQKSVNRKSDDLKDKKNNCFFFNMIKIWPFTIKNRLSDMIDNKMGQFFQDYLITREKDPFIDLSMSISPLIFLEWTRKYYNENFRDIQNMIQTKEWELVNAGWVDFLPEMLSGELIIRHLLMGQRFLLKWFHKECSTLILTNPKHLDSQIIPILSQMGISQLLIVSFQKKTNYLNLPLNFIWQNKNKTNINDIQKTDKDIDELTATFTPILSSINKTINFQKKWIENNANTSFPLILYNSFPNRLNRMLPLRKIITAQALESIKLGRIVSLQDYWSFIDKIREDLPVLSTNIHYSEDFPTQHQISFINSHIKSCEQLFFQTEFLSLFSGIFGGPHFQDELTNLWELFLKQHNQSLISGQVITEVLRDSAKEFNSIFSALFSTQENSMMHIAHSMKLTLNHDVYSVFNSLSWKRSGYLILPARSFAHVLDANNQPLMTQNIAYSPFTFNREIQLGLTFVEGLNYLKNIEQELEDIRELQDLNVQIDYNDEDFDRKTAKDKLYAFENAEKENLLIYLPPQAEIYPFGISNIYGIKSSIEIQNREKLLIEYGNDFIFENSLIKVKISKDTGYINWLSEKISSNSELNLLKPDGYYFNIQSSSQILKSKSSIMYPVKKLYQNLKEFKIKSIQIEEKGPIRYSLRCHYHKLHSGTELHVNYYFYHKSSRIEVETLVNWQETHSVLLFNFETSKLTPEITTKSIIGFESIEISNNSEFLLNNIRKERKRNEYNSESMIDLKSREFIIRRTINKQSNLYSGEGIAFFAQNKHYIHVDSSKTTIKLIGSQKTIKPKTSQISLDSDYSQQIRIQEMGFHRILWSLEPVSDKFNDLEIYHHYQEYNTPLVAVPTNAVHPSFSLIDVFPKTIEIMSVKEMEPYMREAPEWFYHPSMSELPFIIRCVNLDKSEPMTNVKITLHKKIEIKEVTEIDPIEKIINQNIQPGEIRIVGQELHFQLKPMQIKTILVVCKLPLENDEALMNN
ncbi:glycoside hydrolase family 38 N-terminal domain-containing protein [Candidatus Harpocratesius sp.]